MLGKQFLGSRYFTVFCDYLINMIFHLTKLCIGDDSNDY